MGKRTIIPEFFSRDKKTNLLPLLLLTVVTGAGIAAFIATGAEKYAAVMCILMAGYALCASLALLRAFRHHHRGRCRRTL